MHVYIVISMVISMVISFPPMAPKTIHFVPPLSASSWPTRPTGGWKGPCLPMGTVSIWIYLVPPMDAFRENLRKHRVFV